jgi:hypothetical protein
MTGGYVTSHWPFVWAAYGLTATGLILYGISLFVRLKGARKP